MGSDAFSLPIFLRLAGGGPQLPAPIETVGVVTQPDRPSGRGRKLRPNGVKTAALERGIAVLQPERVRRPEAIDEVLAFGPDVIIVASFGQILPKRLLDSPPGGCLNLHPSLLPQYRGPSPIACSILSGDTATGTTLMLMAPEMDAGPIVSQRETLILPCETTGELEARLADLSGTLLLDHLTPWLAGALKPREQDDASATYTRRLTKEDGQINWSEAAGRLQRMVRAYNPWPAAYTFWRDRQLKILRARSASGEAEPGRVVGLSEGRLRVGTGDGILEIVEAQLAGSRGMAAADLVSGHRDLLDAVLGGTG
jgi:methionyl-tRNA formyltransferase